MVDIIPSMLVADEDTFTTQIGLAKDAVHMVQLDLADGQFVPNTTWAYSNPQRAQEIADIDFELHLMVSDPVATLQNWKDNLRMKRVLFHFESVEDVATTISDIKELSPNVDIGIVLNPPTPVDAIAPYLDQLQAVMFMGVNPGFQGQAFIPETLERIREFRAKGTDHFVEVDGAVNESTAKDIVAAGANAVCPGSAIFGNDRSPKENVERMRELINTLT